MNMRRRGRTRKIPCVTNTGPTEYPSGAPAGSSTWIKRASTEQMEQRQVLRQCRDTGARGDTAPTQQGGGAGRRRGSEEAGQRFCSITGGRAGGSPGVGVGRMGRRQGAHLKLPDVLHDSLAPTPCARPARWHRLLQALAAGAGLSSLLPHRAVVGRGEVLLPGQVPLAGVREGPRPGLRVPALGANHVTCMTTFSLYHGFGHEC